MPDAVDFIARMQAHIENLVKLQAVDLERARLTKEARSLPVQITDAIGHEVKRRQPTATISYLSAD